MVKDAGVGKEHFNNFAKHHGFKAVMRQYLILLKTN
jgi:hypothetical protein